MQRSFIATLASTAALAMLAVAVPEPIVLDVLGVGMACLGLDIICDGRVRF